MRLVIADINVRLCFFRDLLVEVTGIIMALGCNSKYRSRRASLCSRWCLRVSMFRSSLFALRLLVNLTLVMAQAAHRTRIGLQFIVRWHWFALFVCSHLLISALGRNKPSAFDLPEAEVRKLWAGFMSNTAKRYMMCHAR